MIAPTKIKRILFGSIPVEGCGGEGERKVRRGKEKEETGETKNTNYAGTFFLPQSHITLGASIPFPDPCVAVWPLAGQESLNTDRPNAQRRKL